MTEKSQFTEEEAKLLKIAISDLVYKYHTLLANSGCLGNENETPFSVSKKIETLENISIKHF